VFESSTRQHGRQGSTVDRELTIHGQVANASGQDSRRLIRRTLIDRLGIEDKNIGEIASFQQAAILQDKRFSRQLSTGANGKLERNNVLVENVLPQLPWVRAVLAGMALGPVGASHHPGLAHERLYVALLHIERGDI